MRGNEVTAQCHALALLRRDSSTRTNPRKRRAEIEIRVEGQPRKGAGVRDDQRHPLDGHEHGDHSNGLQKPAMGTMHDRRGRYAAYTTRLVDGVLTQPGHTPPELRRAVLEQAAGSGGRNLPPALAQYVNTVARHAYKVTDEDVGRLQQAGHSDDALFEVTVSAALGAALGRLERGLAALRGESSPPVPLSATRRGGTRD